MVLSSAAGKISAGCQEPEEQKINGFLSKQAASAKSARRILYSFSCPLFEIIRQIQREVACDCKGSARESQADQTLQMGFKALRYQAVRCWL
jgi:hypothetical protein